MNDKKSPNAESQRTMSMTDLPLFPLNVVLFPGMTLPLHIFEPRYQEMIGYCLEKKRLFGVVLISKGHQVGAPAIPHKVGTTAKIQGVKRYDDGRMDISVVGLQRFHIDKLDYSRSYLQASAHQLAVLNGATRQAGQLASQVRPRLAEYAELLSRAYSADNQLGYIPHDAKTLAFLIASSLQIDNDKKQHLLELPGVPEMLAEEYKILGSEIRLTEHMLATQDNLDDMSGGSSGYLFVN